MPKLRANPEQQVAAAIADLEALAHDGAVAVTRSGPDQVRIVVGRHSWPARVIARQAVSLRDAQMLVETESRGSKILVTNQLSGEAKRFLEARNVTLPAHWWSWLDRRGELQLNDPKATGVVRFEKSSLHRRPSLPGGQRLAAPRSDGPIRGRAGISCAAALLLHPLAPPSIRAIARDAAMSHGAVGDASKSLREWGLVLPSGQPQLPDLFWALAAVWSPTRVTPVKTLPTPEITAHLRAGLDHLDAPGWCVGGDEAAAAWGAPVISAEPRPWVWVPQESDARRAERSLHPAAWDDYAAVVAVPPTVIACSNRLIAPGPVTPAFLPTTHPLFLALELAQDPSRGHEILDQWHPVQPDVHRVW